MTIKKFMHHYVSVLLVLVLAGCGGGGGSPATNTVLPVATVMQGIYLGQVDTYDFFSVALPAADATKVDWYGLTFRPTVTDI